MAEEQSRYQLIATLGHGGMADVFLAVLRGPAGFNKLQVIKRLRPNLAQEPEFVNMFMDEARLAARLNHPNVVQTNEVGEIRGRPYIAMEYLDGQGLNRIVHRAGYTQKLPLSFYLSLASQVLAGLEHAHTLKDYDGKPLEVVHRDISPHNIIVTYDGLAKLVDFGIAKAATRSSDTRHGVLKGKAAYMSPEQGRFEESDCRADLFSMGVILWELIAGRRMWKDVDELEIIERLVTFKLPKLEEHDPTVPPELLAIVERALAREREDRYPTAAAMREDLERFLQQRGERMDASEIGKRLAQLFANERAEIQQTIDRCLRGLSKSEETTAGGLGDDAHLEDIPMLTAPGAGSASGQRTQSPLARSASGRIAPRRRNLWVWAVLGLGVVGAGAFTLARGGNEPPPAPARTEVSTPPAETASPEPSAAPMSLKLRIAATPPEAEIFLDGARLPTNPHDAKFARDGLSHRLRVTANGYVEQSRMLVFDQDIDVKIELEAKDAGAPTARPAASPRPRKPSKTTLDNDPWAK
jgi:serine/threonine-protein kinase